MLGNTQWCTGDHCNVLGAQAVREFYKQWSAHGIRARNPTFSEARADSRNVSKAFLAAITWCAPGADQDTVTRTLNQSVAEVLRQVRSEAEALKRASRPQRSPARGDHEHGV